MPESKASSSPSLISRIQDKLFQLVDIQPLVYFRIAFGALMLYQVVDYFTHDKIFKYFIEPKHLIKFYGFEWVQPWPGTEADPALGMNIHFLVMGILAVLIAIGFLYRYSTLLFFLAFTYVFLLDQTRYLNHFYMISLVSFLMIFAPAHRNFSVDSRLHPKIKTDKIPYWPVFLLQLQVAAVYFFGGVAKLNYDWLHGEPIRMWLAKRFDLALVGQFVTEEWLVYFICYGGLLFDLFIIPLIIWRKTRWFALAGALFFHVTNSWLFSIGVFPWFMIAATVILFIPGWPGLWPEHMAKRKKALSPPRPSKLVMGFVVLYTLYQIFMPLRHWLYPGNVHWTEEGHKYAWHMKLRSKISISKFYIVDAQRGMKKEIPANYFLNDWQIKVVSGVPEQMVQFAHILKHELEEQGIQNIEINAISWTSLNGRNFQLLMDSTVNLLDLEVSLKHNPYIIPLSEPFVNTRPYNLEQLEKISSEPVE